MNAHLDLPPIILASCDYNRLMFTAMMGQDQGNPVFEFLLSELRRAEICHPAALPEEVVSANCRVIYRVDDEPTTRAHLLVHPENLMWLGAELSLTTPLGAALVGLRIGDCMPYTETDGSRHEVLVEGVGLRFLDEGLISINSRAAAARLSVERLFIRPSTKLTKISH